MMGESQTTRSGSLRGSLYALVPPGTCSRCPLLSNGVDLSLSPLLSLLLSCFCCRRNRRVPNHPSPLSLGPLYKLFVSRGNKSFSAKRISSFGSQRRARRGNSTSE